MGLILLVCVAPLVVSSVTPTNGPAAGGTVVIVQGTYCLQQLELMCKFGTLVAAATYKSSTRLECLSPSQSAAVVAVELSNNNQDFSRTALHTLTMVRISISR